MMCLRLFALVLIFVCQVNAADSAPNAEVTSLFEQTERMIKKGNTNEALKAYRSAVLLDNSIGVRRRFADMFYSAAEHLRMAKKGELDASLAALDAAKAKATKKTHSILENSDYGKFDPKDPGYLAAVEKHKEILKKISICFPFYDAAEENYAAVLKLTPNGKDFDAAAHQPLCLIYKQDIATRGKCRLLLVNLIKNYKPNGGAEEALFEQCKAELEKRDL